MSFKKRQRSAMLIAFIVSATLCLLFSANAFSLGCKGRFVNPVTDICWKCIFPLKIGGIAVPRPGLERAPDTASGDSVSPLCYCPTPFPRVGLTLSFWEPVRLVDVTRTAFCFPSLGGITINPGLSVAGGVVDADESGDNTSIYHVHYYIYPLIYWLNILVDAVCLESEGL